jgi:hypothetical protein
MITTTKSTTIYIDVEAYAGSNIETVCKEMCELAARIGISVWARFNGKRVLARPDDDWKKLYADWYMACEEKRQICSAKH